jgi:sarcosine oxidase delta subunit
MKINFAQVPHDDIDTFGDDNLFGPDVNGNFYYNYLEFGTNPGGVEEVAIHDGCGRYMPISVDSIPDLIAALTEIARISDQLILARQLETYAESYSEAYVENDQVRHDPESVHEIAQRHNY